MFWCNHRKQILFVTEGSGLYVLSFHHFSGWLLRAIIVVKNMMESIFDVQVDSVIRYTYKGKDLKFNYNWGMGKVVPIIKLNI